jgi:hypothetical protein
LARDFRMRLIPRARKSVSAGIAGITALILFGGTCQFFQERIPEMRSLLPGDIEVPGWEMIGNPDHCSEDSIQKYQNCVQLSEMKDFRELITAQYRSLQSHSLVLSVVIVRMDSFLSAFNQFSTECGFEKRISLFPISSLSSQEVYFVKGSYYVRMHLAEEIERLKKDVFFFATIIYRNITEKNRLPQYSSLFGQGESTHNLLYYRNFQGDFPELKNVFMRKRMIEGREYTVFFARRQSPSSALTEFNRIVSDPVHPAVVTQFGAKRRAFRGDTSGGYTFLSSYREWIFGVINAESLKRGDAITGVLYKELLEFSRKM